MTKLQELVAEIENKSSNIAITKLLHEMILQIGSETPDNIACVNELEYSRLKFPKIDGDERRRGLCFKNSKMSLSDLAYSLEDMERIPLAIQNSIPNLGLDEWHAFTRLTTLLYIALESNR